MYSLLAQIARIRLVLASDLDKELFGKPYEVVEKSGITVVRVKSCRFKILFRNHYRFASFCSNLANL